MVKLNLQKGNAPVPPGAPSPAARPPAEVLIKRLKHSRQGDTWELVRARGHLDEVTELRKGGTKLGGAGDGAGTASPRVGSAGDGAGSGGLSAVNSAGSVGADGGGSGSSSSTLMLLEGMVLGGGAFSRVSIVSEESTKRTYALKRMRKIAVVQVRLIG